MAITLTRTKEFLGVGFNFPFSFNTDTGSVTISEATHNGYEEHINDSIQQILFTELGSSTTGLNPISQRVIRRNFGSYLNALVFLPLNNGTANLVKTYVIDAITNWEKRINITDTSIMLHEKIGSLEINISYTIISTNTSGNLVFPFYLSDPSIEVN